MLADDSLHGRLPRGLLAIDGKKKREGNSKGAGLEWLVEAASLLASAAEGRRKGVGRIGDWEVIPVCGAARDAVAEGAAVVG